MPIDYSSMKWADILAQAKADHQKQWSEKDSFDYLSGGITNIGGQSGQIYLRDGTMNPSQYVRPGEAAADYDPWANLNINLKDPNGPDGYMTRLSQGENGGVKVDHYLQNDTGLGAWAPFAMVLPAFGAAMSAAGGAAAAGAGAGAASGGTAAIPAGGMTATGTLGPAPWAATSGGVGTLGTGTLGATTSGVGAAMGTTGGAFGLGSGLAGVTAADLAAAGGLAGAAGTAGLSSGASSGGSAASGAGEIAVDGVNQLANEAAKLAAQNSAAPGSLLNTTLPTITTTAGGGMWEGLLDKAIDFGTSKVGSSLIGAGISALSGANQPNSTTQTSTTQLDPRMQSLLYGDGQGNAGLMGQILANQNKPQSAGMQQFGAGMESYLKDWGTNNFMSAQQAAQGLMQSNINAPSMQAASVANTPGMQAAMMNAAQINAPSQNNINLSSAYNDMVYGQAGNNPYLTGAIQKGINQSSNAFGNMLTDATKATQSLLGDIRGGAIVNGQMGSSRQGIAEGKALDSFNTQVGRAMSQFGQNNTDAAVAAQAGAYDADRNRALAAMSGLSGNQYGTATQNAAFQQQANLANQAAQNQANQVNYQGSLSMNLANAGYQQGANQANLQSQLGTNQLNSQNQTAGIGLSSGLLGAAYGYGQNQDQYAGNKLGQTVGLISPFTGYGATTSQTTPLYNNTAGNILGGALAGASLYNMWNK